MLCVYYDKSYNFRKLFEDLDISADASFERYLNQYHVIYLDISLFISRASDIKKVICDIQNAVSAEIKDAFPDASKGRDLAEVLVFAAKAANEKFIMIIDKWDALFREAKNDSQLQKEYITLLRSLFKSSWTDTIFDAAYITGILHIK